MRFSLTLGAGGPGRDPRSLAGLAKLAEDSGWDAMFLPSRPPARKKPPASDSDDRRPR
jgi:hypothetical protein